MKKVLIITYYWPPSGGAGVQRWLKMSKYLPESGWLPVVYTPENPEAPVDDPSLLKDIHPDLEVIRRKIWEPYVLYRRFVGMKKDDRINTGFLKEGDKPKNKEGISVWVRGNLFIPDAKRFWIRPSVKYLLKYLRANPVDAIISSGPPHSLHLIARRIKEKLDIAWIADFRDPWTEIDYYDQLRLSRWADRRHRKQEQTVLREADRVVVVGKTMAEAFSRIAGVDSLVIPNGYDEADFRGQNAGQHGPEEPLAGSGKPFSIVHIGAMNGDRNHPVFWEAITELLAEGEQDLPEIRIKLIGKVDISVRQSIRRGGLEDRVDIIASLPHEKIIPHLKSASILYLPINRTPNARMIQTGKLFEYLAAGRPILGVGPEDGDAAAIIRDCRAGIMTGFDDREGLKARLRQWASAHGAGLLESQVAGTESYSRRKLSATLARALEEVCDLKRKPA